jgi:hypothetical protein
LKKEHSYYSAAQKRLARCDFDEICAHLTHETSEESKLCAHGGFDRRRGTGYDKKVFCIKGAGSHRKTGSVHLQYPGGEKQHWGKAGHCAEGPV